MTTPYTSVPLRRFLQGLTDGPFGSSLTGSHYSDDGARVIRLGNIGEARFKSDDEAYIPMEYFAELRRHSVESGDLLIAGLGDLGNPVGRACLAPEGLGPAIVKADCFRARLDERRLLHRFAVWALNSRSVGQQVLTLTRGSTRARINLDVAKAIEIPVPPLEEQRRIADYLDCETARIDTLLEEKQRLIDLLRERWESAIRSVLLLGLNFGVPVRHSGSDLLGQIPSAWRLVPTRYLCTITTGDEDSGNASEDGKYPFYVRGREILRSDDYAFDGEAVMTPGDGQGGTGKVFHYFSGKFQAHQRVYVFTDFQGIDGQFFYYYLSTFLRPIALAGSNTVTMESLRRPLLADFPVAVPPLEEQLKIVEYLDEQTSKTDTLIAETERFIELSKERRAALINAAVTGQIDVREAV